ncbi:transcriptional regulator, partial [Tsukamurella tyrosinosolvens]
RARCARRSRGAAAYHPELGVVELEWSTLEVAAAPGQLVVAYQALEGTASERTLAELVAHVARSS